MLNEEKQEQLLRLPEVLKLFPVSRSHWWAGVKNSSYPKPIKLGPKITVWRASDIQKLIAEVASKSECDI